MGVAHVTLFTCISPASVCYSDFTLVRALSSLLPSSPSFSFYFFSLPFSSFLPFFSPKELTLKSLARYVARVLLGTLKTLSSWRRLATVAEHQACGLFPVPAERTGTAPATGARLTECSASRFSLGSRMKLSQPGLLCHEVPLLGVCVVCVHGSGS